MIGLDHCPLWLPGTGEAPSVYDLRQDAHHVELLRRLWLKEHGRLWLKEHGRLWPTKSPSQ